MRIPHPKMLRNFRGPGKCEWCGRQCKRREAAHIRARGMGNGRQLDIRINLVSLGLGGWSAHKRECTCHEDHHRGERPTTIDLEAVVAAREGVLQGDVREVVDWLLRLPKDISVHRITEALKELNVAQREIAVRTLEEWRA